MLCSAVQVECSSKPPGRSQRRTVFQRAVVRPHGIPRIVAGRPAADQARERQRSRCTKDAVDFPGRKRAIVELDFVNLPREEIGRPTAHRVGPDQERIHVVGNASGCRAGGGQCAVDVQRMRVCRIIEGVGHVVPCPDGRIERHRQLGEASEVADRRVQRPSRKPEHVRVIVPAPKSLRRNDPVPPAH